MISDLISLISVYQIRQFIHVINGIQRNTKNYKNINRSFDLIPESWQACTRFEIVSGPSAQAC